MELNETQKNFIEDMTKLVKDFNIKLFENKEKQLVEDYISFFSKEKEVAFNRFGFIAFAAGTINLLDPNSKFNTRLIKENYGETI